MGIEHATPVILLLLAVMVLPVLHYIKQARAGKEYYVRRIAGVDAIDEAIGRTAEMGRPLAFSTGLTNVSPLLYAILGIMFHVTKKAALYKTKPIYPQCNPEVMAITEDVVRDAYREQGRETDFDPRSIIYLSDEQFAYASGYMGTVQRENIASAFLIGYFAAESLLLAEAGQQVGAMQIAGSVSPEQVPFFISTCDYTLIGEELYAASAYLTREPVQVGSLVAQDRAKMLFFALIILGVLFATMQSFGFDSFFFDIDGLIRASWIDLFEKLFGAIEP